MMRQPTHVVIDSRSGHLFWKCKTGPFTQQTAEHFAAIRNAFRARPTYQVYALRGEMSEEEIALKREIALANATLSHTCPDHIANQVMEQLQLLAKAAEDLLCQYSESRGEPNGISSGN